jgi:hypothetical protein
MRAVQIVLADDGVTDAGIGKFVEHVVQERRARHGHQRLYVDHRCCRRRPPNPKDIASPHPRDAPSALQSDWVEHRNVPPVGPASIALDGGACHLGPECRCGSGAVCCSWCLRSRHHRRFQAESPIYRPVQIRESRYHYLRFRRCRRCCNDWKLSRRLQQTSYEEHRSLTWET